MVSLLERYYDPKFGRISVDGMDIQDLNVIHYRKFLGIVNQEPLLFATSIRENIRFGNPSATEEEVVEAAKAANAHDFICSFPQGYDTQVGDKGKYLDALVLSIFSSCSCQCT